MSEKLLVAFDPGDTTGVALFRYTPGEKAGRFLNMGQFTLEELEQFCATFEEEVHAVVYEKYQVLPHKAAVHRGSKLKASQGIGMIKMLARLKSAEIFEQRPDQMHMATKWSGVKLPKTHSQSHQYSAYNHGFFWLYHRDLIESALEREMRNG